jgi:3-phosphoshikimate 1-carboxyvinyltransferase
MNYIVNSSQKVIRGEIFLPSSKSISNRLQIIQALSAEKIQIHNLSDSDDTQVMLKAFQNNSEIIDIHHAGTSMRFLTAYFAATGQQKIITGSDRMKNRPIQALVTALNGLGAEITYLEKEGFPPLKTSGKPLTGSEISIKGNISSQFITALLLVAPCLPNGLTIHISDKLISESYVNMTLGLMKDFGVEHTWQGNTIHINRQAYKGKDITVESDWSGASYWYQIAALSQECDIVIHGLSENSLQGDAAIAGLFGKLGIVSNYKDNKVYLSKKPCTIKHFEFDFINNPDMIQTFVVTLCLMGITFKISGADTLRVKETDRIAALQNEMKKLGFIISEPITGTLEWNGTRTSPTQHIAIDTYNDHRMALAFAPVALTLNQIVINDAMVVTKSYPSFWDHLKNVGFTITSL